MNDKGISRRSLLAAITTGGALAFGTYWVARNGRPTLVDILLKQGAAPEVPDGGIALWFDLRPNLPIEMRVPKIEMGQGIHSALALMAAEELEIPVSQLTVRQATSTDAFTLGSMFTFGSSSVASLFEPVRLSAAMLRETLRFEAASQMGRPIEDIAMRDGFALVEKAPAALLSYEDVIAAKVGPWVPVTSVTMKAPSDFHTIGKVTIRLDAQTKATGRAIYGYNARANDMLYGAVLRPPRFGAELTAVDGSAAITAPGLVQVVVDIPKNFAGVVAATRTQARDALAKLKPTWSGGTTNGDLDIDRLTTVSPGQGNVLDWHGDVTEAFASGEVIRAEYRTPMAAHMHMEPVAALAAVTTKTVKVWVSTQHPGSVKNDIAPEFPGHTIEVVPTAVGGGFGRKTAQHAALEAARLSAAVGKPVHVGWTRLEDFQHGFYRPATHHVLEARLVNGQVIGFRHQLASADIIFGRDPPPGGDTTIKLIGFDPGIVLGFVPPYHFKNSELRYQRVETQIPTGPWRGLGLLPNVFALESFMDHLARSAAQDPLAFRLAYLPNDDESSRLRAVLSRVAAMSGWANKSVGQGWGLACCEDVGTAVAMVAKVKVESGAVVVQKVFAAIDCGLVVSPGGARAQVMGSIIMGLSSTLHERLIIENGAVAQAGFEDYPILRYSEVPEIDIAFIESEAAPTGLGEPPIGPVAAAVANAVTDATGKQLSAIPLQI
jgi:isoquinoline 1-oxidoreductase subunit beta